MLQEVCTILETITIDANTGRAFAGTAELIIEQPTAWLDEIAQWRRALRC